MGERLEKGLGEVASAACGGATTEGGTNRVSKSSGRGRERTPLTLEDLTSHNVLHNIIECRCRDTHVYFEIKVRPSRQTLNGHGNTQ
jgi:hypothetical protein